MLPAFKDENFPKFKELVRVVMPEVGIESRNNIGP